MKVDLGCGLAKPKGYIGTDKVSLPGVDTVFDLEKRPWPFPSESVSELRASHVLEHIHDLIAFMEEAHRVLVPHGLFEIIVPAWTSPGAFEDPTHARYFTDRTFDHFSPDGPHAYYTKAHFRVISFEGRRTLASHLRYASLRFLLEKVGT